jgi:hypothetical protein
MSTFKGFNKNIQNFSLQTVAGVKNVFTFALPTTTTYSLTETESLKGKQQNEMIGLRGHNIDHQVL